MLNREWLGARLDIESSGFLLMHSLRRLIQLFPCFHSASRQVGVHLTSRPTREPISSGIVISESRFNNELLKSPCKFEYAFNYFCVNVIRRELIDFYISVLIHRVPHSMSHGVQIRTRHPSYRISEQVAMSSQIFISHESFEFFFVYFHNNNNPSTATANSLGVLMNFERFDTTT